MNAIYIYIYRPIDPYRKNRIPDILVYKYTKKQNPDFSLLKNRDCFYDIITGF